jgi:carboxylesterase
MRLLLLIFFFSAPAFAANEECIRKLGLELKSMNAALQEKYLEIDDKGQIRPGNEAVFLPGKSDEAAIVIHGFAASPFEVQELGKVLHQRGVTVYMPLLPGFGTTAKVANGFHREDWKNTLTTSLENFSECFSEITLSGFSTGGTTVTNFLLNQKPVAGIHVKRVALLSPYLESDSEFANILNVAAGLFADSISVQDLYNLSKNSDLEAILKNPGYYNDELPLKAAQQVVRFGRDVRKQAETNLNAATVPTLVAYSHADKTIATEHVEDFYKHYFTQVNFYTYAEELHIPHQITVPNMNPNTNELVNHVADFLLNRGGDHASIGSEQTQDGAPDAIEE